MHIGFKYHVASLVAIFFSLVLGMLIGSALFQDDGLVQEQGYMIGDLENRFKALEIRTKTLQDSLDLALEKEAVITALWDQVKMVFFNNRLQDHDVVLYGNEDLPNLESLSAVIVKSGARFHGTAELPVDTAELKQSLSKLELNSKKQPIAIVYANTSPLNSTSLEYLHNAGWRVSIIQPFDSGVNVKDYIKESLVITGIDTPIGELALIQALAQSLTGRFGWGREFASLIPILDVE